MGRRGRKRERLEVAATRDPGGSAMPPRSLESGLEPADVLQAAMLADGEDGGPEERRAKAVRQLVKPGRRRLELAAELDRASAALRPLILEAVQAGLTYRRIAELTGISRATVGRWVKESAHE